MGPDPSVDKDRCISFQTGVEIEVDGAKHLAVPRTLEEAIAYENLAQLRAGTLSIGIDVPASWPAVHEDVYLHIRSDKFKKTAFAMSLLATDTDWTTPSYITEGLVWLEGRLSPITIIGAGA